MTLRNNRLRLLLSQFSKSSACRIGQQLGAQGHGVEFDLDTQTFELDGRANGHEDVAASRVQRLCLRLCQGSVGFQVLVKHLHLLPVFCSSREIAL